MGVVHGNRRNGFRSSVCRPPGPGCFWAWNGLRHGSTAGTAGRSNALLSLPDDQLLYLVAILRDTPQPPPALSPEEWQAFLDLLRPYGVYPLLAYRLRAWPEDCQPPAEVMVWLAEVLFHEALRVKSASWLVRTIDGNPPNGWL